MQQVKVIPCWVCDGWAIRKSPDQAATGGAWYWCPDCQEWQQVDTPANHGDQGQLIGQAGQADQPLNATQLSLFADDRL